MRRLIRAAAALLLGLAAACGAPGDPEGGGSLDLGVPRDGADIVGEVTQAQASGQATRLLVEQVPTRSAGYPIAWVFVTPGTRILVRSGGRTTRGTAADLGVGASIHAWFTGPVRESYPVQADAGTLLVER